MRFASLVGALLSAVVGCSPQSSADDAPGSGGSAGFGAAPVAGGAAGTAAGGTGAGFTTLSGVNPGTPLDQLSGAQLVQACNDFAQYFTAQVPNADIVRGNCVQDAVFRQGKTNVVECQQAADQCVASAGAVPPLQCSEPAAGFKCSATIAMYQQCGSDLTASEKSLYALLVCQSIDDPDIQQKLADARAASPACTAFTQSCPSFFPVPVTGTGGTAGAGGVAGTGGSPIPPGTGGVPGSGFTTLSGVDPATPLDQLQGPQLVQACNDFAQYFSNQVPNADITRGNCVQDAVFKQNATTVPQCQQVSGQCIANAQPPAPIQCAEPASGFTCSAPLSLYEQCGTDLTASQKALYALLVCESIDDPNIQQKLDTANAPSASCTSFTQACPSFFPTPAP